MGFGGVYDYRLRGVWGCLWMEGWRYGYIRRWALHMVYMEGKDLGCNCGSVCVTHT